MVGIECSFWKSFSNIFEVKIYEHYMCVPNDNFFSRIANKS